MGKGKRGGSKGKPPRADGERRAGTAQGGFQAVVAPQATRGPVSVRPAWARPPAPREASWRTAAVLALDAGGTFHNGETSIANALDEGLRSLRGERRSRRFHYDLDLFEVLMVPWRAGIIGVPFHAEDVARADPRFSNLPRGIGVGPVDACLERLSQAGMLTQVLDDLPRPQDRFDRLTLYQIRLPSDPPVMTGEQARAGEDWSQVFQRLAAETSKMASAMTDAAEKMRGLGEAMRGVSKRTGELVRVEQRYKLATTRELPLSPPSNEDPDG